MSDDASRLASKSLEDFFLEKMGSKDVIMEKSSGVIESLQMRRHLSM